MNNDNKEVIGSIYYDYPKKESLNSILRVRFIALEEKYRGQSFGIKMYEKLLEEAKNKNLDGIGSDAAVQRGAISVWKKLMDKGYKLTINPSIEEKWKRFVDTYNEGKIFKEMLSVANKDSVFKILLKEQKVK